MSRPRFCILLVTIVLAFDRSAGAQVTTGTLIGRVTDPQGAATPGVTVTATNGENGFVRSDVTDAAGAYRLAALPVGPYTVRIALAGFQPIERMVVVNIATTDTLDAILELARVAASVEVTAAAAPLVSTRSSSVGEVVDLTRIESLPLNGRQFANLAAIVPGVGLGQHTDPSKNAQYTPQISGGNGRNVNYIVDGGDNNDDTVGGLLQLYPLEAVQEFNLVTQRFDAEYGRSNGAVLNVVTKSGTNQLRGSGFSLFRDDVLNARTESERIANASKQPYHRYQYGGSLGGPIVRDRLHYFAAYERTQQQTKQVVATGIFADDGIYDVPFTEDLVSGKITSPLSPSHYLAVRYGFDRNTQVSGAGRLIAHSAWATTTNTFNSVNVNHNWVQGGARLNELVAQYSRYTNDTPPGVSGPSIVFGSIAGGASLNAPARTEQTKWQLQDTYSWTHAGFGSSHEVKTGAAWIHEPRLFALTGQALNGVYTLGTPSLSGPVVAVIQTGGNLSANSPMELFGVFVQDDWRATDRLTLNLGVRWDYVAGMSIDQSRSANFQAMQAAGATGRFAGTVLEDFGKTPRGDRDNVQPRIGVVYDLAGNGRDVVRAGWGLYTDFGYTNSNSLTASIDANGGGLIFSAQSNTALLKSDGTLFTVNDPISAIADQNAVNPALPIGAGEVVSPRLEQPYTRQTNVGWSHAFSETTAASVDYVRVDGRDLNMRIRPNARINGVRLLADVPVQPNNFNFRTAVSKGRSAYDAAIVALRRRLSHGLDVNASYTLARAASDVGTAYDEIAPNLIQDVTDAFSDVQMAPSARTDARHRVTISALVDVPAGVRIAPIFSYRSALPLHTIEGIDFNGDGNVNDRTPVAYRYTGLTDAGTATFEEAGPCDTVNCSRRASFSQLNLRVSRSFAVAGSVRLEAIAEVFNLFNAKNPVLNTTTTRLTGGVPRADFMQPIAFAGDLGQTEQRVGQAGFRLTF